MIFPDSFTNGNDQGRISVIYAVARETTKSYFSLCSGSLASTSALSWIAMIPCSQSSDTKWFIAFTFFPTESRSVTRSSGMTIFKGIPGNPHPEPISRSRIAPSLRVCEAIESLWEIFLLFSGSLRSSRWRECIFWIISAPYSESTKCFSRIPSSSRIAERLVCWLYSLKSVRNFSKRGISEWERWKWCKRKISWFISWIIEIRGENANESICKYI